MWSNLAASAEWCVARAPRSEWIAPVSPDPIYLNLYDRFYAMMHDMAIMEHLAFAYAYSGERRYFDAGRRWTLACCRIWGREAEGKPNASKAYAVMRLLKGVAVSYDLLYDSLSGDDRESIRSTLAGIGGKYYEWYIQNPGMAGAGQDKHHGSVEASSFGIAALALLGEVTDASNWLELMVKKHTEYLLPHALTASGTQEQSSNYWASTMQYRIAFMDALRRVTGRDLFKDYKQFMGGRIALAAVVGVKEPGWNENYRSVLFGPSYGQLDYWSPVLLYLATEYRRPIYQHLALWDRSLGAAQRTRYVTSNGEELLFTWGGYAYAWYDSTVPDKIPADVPLSFEFPDVGEVYVRASYEPGGLAVGMRKGGVIVHAGGRAVVADLAASATKNVTLDDSGSKAIIRHGSANAQRIIALRRPNVAIVRTETTALRTWWCHNRPTQAGDTLKWPDGTEVRVTTGSIVSIDPKGHHDQKIVGMGRLTCVDPMPMR